MSSSCNYLPPPHLPEGTPQIAVGRSPPPPPELLWDIAPVWLPLLVATVWMLTFFYMTSSRGGTLVPFLGLDGMLPFVWLLATLAGALVLTALVGVLGWYGLRGNFVKMRRIAILLAPFPITAFLTFSPLWSNDWPLQLRFSLSRGSFDAVADDFERSGKSDQGPYLIRRAGLYQVEMVYRLDNCVVVVTGGFFLDELGFARCQGQPAPQPHYIEFEYLKDDWYTFLHSDN